MGVRTTLTITCDYSECKGRQNGPSVIEWVQEDIKAGAPLPPAAASIVSMDLNGTKLAFCKLLCAARFFAPPGFEVVQKKVIDFPDNGNFPGEPDESVASS